MVSAEVVPALLNTSKMWSEANLTRGVDNNGQMEVVLPDGTRCECVANTHAIEFDIGSNWAETNG